MVSFVFQVEFIQLWSVVLMLKQKVSQLNGLKEERQKEKKWVSCNLVQVSDRSF